MDPVIKWSYEKKAHEIVDILNSHMFDAKYCASKEEVKGMVEEILFEGAKVAVGGSMTLKETSIYPDLVECGKYNFVDRYHATSYENMLELYREGLLSDVFVTSVNAVTKDGELLLIDCTGNRASAVIFGPKKVVVIVGVNKVVENLEEGLARCRKVAPLNARRLPHKGTPCYEDGVCKKAICKMHDRVCNNIAIIDGCYYTPQRISVIVVPEELGY